MERVRSRKDHRLKRTSSERRASSKEKILNRCIVLLLTILSGSAAFAAPAFWEGKPKLEARMRDERAVLVSVRTNRGEVDKEADLFSIQGVGWVKRDAHAVFELAKQFDRLKDISDHFREVKYEPKTNRIFVICEALGYQARMLMHVEAVEGVSAPEAGVTMGAAAEPSSPLIKFKVIDGHFIGLEGSMVFRELKQSPGQTEVSLRVRHEAREIPIPRILVGFALEVMVQKVAMKMRTYFESAPLTVGPPAAQVPEDKPEIKTAPVTEPKKK